MRSSARGATRSADRVARRAARQLERTFGGPARTQVILVLASVLALSSADTATVGASAIQLRAALHISNTDIGLLVAASAVVACLASVPFGVLADRVKRTRMLGLSIVLWGAAMLWSATVGSFAMLLLARMFLGIVTAVAGPVVASLVGDYFPSAERGRIYSWILTGELAGAGVGFAVTGDIAALSWRAAFVILAVPTFVLARFAFKLPEPRRGGSAPLLRDGVGPANAPDLAGARRLVGETPAHGGPVPDDQVPHPETDAQRLARQRGVAYDRDLVEGFRLDHLRFSDAVRYILRIPTNVTLIIASACGYFYLAGVQTFGVEFVTQQYGVNQVLANLLLLILGGAAVIGVLTAGALSDSFLSKGYLNARVMITGVAALFTVALFVPALATRSSVTALPYLALAAFMLSAQNPPIDAARLDIVPAQLWGRAEGVRTAMRTGAQALAPILFGAVADNVFGGGRSGLQLTFIVMLVPLTANAVVLLRATRTYPRDVATAAAAAARARAQSAGRIWDPSPWSAPGDPPKSADGQPPADPTAPLEPTQAYELPLRHATGWPNPPSDQPEGDPWRDETDGWPEAPRLPPAHWSDPPERP